MKTAIIPVLRSVLVVALLCQSPSCFADIFEDQFTQLKAKQISATVDINRKYAEYLGTLLEKVSANKDVALATRIRQEMADIGFPAKDDWILGEWSVRDSDNHTRGYSFNAKGVATYTKWDNGAAPPTPPGSFTKEPDGSYKAIMGAILLIIAKDAKGDVIVTRWNSKDYPDKTKAISGTARR